MIYPEILSGYSCFSHSQPFTKKKSLLPPLTLMTAAASIPDSFNIRILDMNIENLTDEAVQTADIVLISGSIEQKESFGNAAEKCTSLGKPVAACGPYPASAHNEIENVDYFILDRDEITIPEFIGDFVHGRPRPVYRAGEKSAAKIPPIPRFDLIDTRNYENMAIRFSKGCPRGCEFCDIAGMFGNRARTKTTDQFMRELDAMFDTDFTGSVRITDDNFIGDKHAAEALLRELAKWQEFHNYPYSFFTRVSADITGEDSILKLMRKAGFGLLHIGIETPDADGALLAGIEKIQRLGMEVSARFTVGFDTDTEDIFDRQSEFIRRSGIAAAEIRILHAAPGTDLHHRLAKEGRLDSFEGEPDSGLNFAPVMKRDRLLAGYRKMISSMYSPENYFERASLFYSRLSEPGSAAGRRCAYGIFFSIRAMLCQTFSPYGPRYVLFLIRSLLKSPSNFSAAIDIGMKGRLLFKAAKKNASGTGKRVHEKGNKRNLVPAEDAESGF
jgi:radical SAM superfamily enzyme YgiQ (UPF0313 family)